MDRRQFLRNTALLPVGIVRGGSPRESFAQKHQRQYYDLSNGLMRCSVARSSNIWVTEIQSILELDGTDHVAYLGHECRAEGIGPNPLDNKTRFEFLNLKTWRGNYDFRTGINLARESYSASIYMSIEVNAPKRNIADVAFDQLIGDQVYKRNNRLFYQFRYRLEGQTYYIGTPVGYLNTGYIPGRNKHYIQPMSGYVCFEYGGMFRVGYLAVYIEDDVVLGAQIVYRNAVESGVTFSWRGILRDRYTSNFDQVVTLDISAAAIRFFSYV